MKKVLFSMMVAFVAISFAACGKFGNAAGVNDADSLVVDSVEVVDSMVVDTLVVDSVTVDTVLAE